jgi:FkbM family methyltransferase
MTCKDRSKWRVGGRMLRLLPKTLAALNNVAFKAECEVVIADYCSADWPLKNWIHQQLSGVPVQILNLGDRYFSRGKGLNAAAANSHGRVLLFTDADILLSDEFLRDCLALTEGSALFPICLSIADPYNRTGEYAAESYGICAMGAHDFKAVGPWPEWTSWGGEGEYIHKKAQERLHVVRKTYNNVIHQWHPKYLGQYENSPNYDYDLYTGCKHDRIDSGFLYTADMRSPAKEQIVEFERLYSGYKSVDVAINSSAFVIRCRPRTSDLPVLFDTFQGLYHLPPHQLPENATILDLGANIGCTILHFISLFPTARIIGVEMDQENYALAEFNLRGFLDQFTLIHAAVWVEDCEVSYGGQEAWGFHVVQNGHNRIQAVTIQTIMAEHNIDQIDYLKMDVEGAEQNLLTTKAEWLLKTNAIKIEVHDNDAAIPTFIEKLTQAGLKAWKDTHHWSCVVGLRE